MSRVTASETYVDVVMDAECHISSSSSVVSKIRFTDLNLKLIIWNDFTY